MHLQSSPSNHSTKSLFRTRSAFGECSSRVLTSATGHQFCCKGRIFEDNLADAVVDAVWSFLEFTTLLDVVAENASLACCVARRATASAMQMDLPEMLIIAMKYPYTDYLSKACEASNLLLACIVVCCPSERKCVIIVHVIEMREDELAGGE